MSTDNLVYESVVDFAADGPRRGLLNPPRGSDGKVLSPQPAPATSRERCAECGSPAVRVRTVHGSCQRRGPPQTSRVRSALRRE